MRSNTVCCSAQFIMGTKAVAILCVKSLMGKTQIIKRTKLPAASIKFRPGVIYLRYAHISHNYCAFPFIFYETRATYLPDYLVLRALQLVFAYCIKVWLKKCHNWKFYNK